MGSLVTGFQTGCSSDLACVGAPAERRRARARRLRRQSARSRLALRKLRVTSFRPGRPRLADLRHATAELVDGDDALFEKVIGDRGDPALVIAHLVVGAGTKLLDAAAQLVGGDEAALAVPQQAHDGLDPLLPGRVAVLRGLDRTRRQPAPVVVAAQQPMRAAGAALGFLANVASIGRAARS